MHSQCKMPYQAMIHFEDAFAICRKAGYRPELAWTCCDYADMLRERDGDGDRAKAVLAGRILGYLQRAWHAASDGAGAVPVGDTGGVIKGGRRCVWKEGLP